MSEALSTVQAELTPALEQLVRLVDSEGEVHQRDFFQRVLDGVRGSTDLEDLAAPMMELSTSAFLGFHYSLAAQLLLDRTLEIAQTAATTLSAHTENPH